MSTVLVHPKHQRTFNAAPNKVNQRLIHTTPHVLYSRNGTQTRWRLMLMHEQLEQGQAPNKRSAMAQAQAAKRRVLERKGWTK